MGGCVSFSNSNETRNRYLEQYQPPPPLPPPPPCQDLYSNENDPRLHNHGQPPLYTRKIMNEVSLDKHTIRIDLDPNNPHHHLIPFTFHASYGGRITIIYLAKEEENCRPQIFKPVTFPFQRGLHQKFFQPSGTGIDLRLFDLDDLSNPSPEQDVFPLVVCAETDALSVDASPNMQITQAVLDKSDSVTGTFQVKVVKQILWVDQLRFALSDIYGAGESVPTDFNRNDPGKDCVICLIEPRDTVVLPCRHMSMCLGCAEALRFESNKCPICHESIGGLMDITR